MTRVLAIKIGAGVLALALAVSPLALIDHAGGRIAYGLALLTIVSVAAVLWGARHRDRVQTIERRW